MSKGDTTRNQILRRAMSEASRFGLEGVSIGGLAKEVGMSKSGLFAHFGSKEGLQIAILQRASDQFTSAIIRPAIALPRGEPRCVAMMENWLTWSDSKDLPGGCLFASSTFEYDDRPGPVRDTLVVHIQALHDTLRRAAAIAVEEGHFRADLDIDQFAFSIHSLLLGYHVQARLFRAPNAREMVSGAFQTLLASARA